MNRIFYRCLSFALAAVLLSGCAQISSSSTSSLSSSSSASSSQGSTSAEQTPSYVDEVSLGDVVLEDEAVALAATPAAIPSDLTPVASGTLTKKNDKAVIDYSNTKDGYVMVQYTASTSKRLKAQVKGPTTTYTYNLTAGQWETFPLSDGNGAYQFIVYENIEGTKYAAVLSVSCTVALTDEFAPFLRPNQYVDYASAPNTVAKAAELTKGISDPLKKVEAVYNYVVTNLTYDKQLAATVQSGYLPVLDTVLANKTGICFDYAALMTGMLRSQNVPCKLVVGYAGSAYHAWISVWSDTTGWVDGAIYFDGTSWQRMDPTFASSGKQSQSIMAYIGDGKNYSAKYFY
ncbi:transglutaminase-like domain-containing protein [Flavonifractor sp. An100]|uniref:transglutaminase-like domain-containing protein n=1 Tax=Flavonifractor sp. An100 TaxID=1965538 RepID=UPI000B3AE610|nr:transglutaminase-like domain-containing protein [Flavonifractor sp. An100]OUQ81654.1 transglutaminase [Flavonifractor sp. An100]